MQTRITDYFGAPVGGSFIVNDGRRRRLRMMKQKADRLKKKREIIQKVNRIYETKSQRYNRMVYDSAKGRVFKEWLLSKPIDDWVDNGHKSG
jgi:hypothetical protein